MITQEQFKAIGLDVDELTGNAAIEWIAAKTTIDTTDITKLSASARLFIKKYAEIDGIPSGVASENIEGLSQSFNQTKSEDLIWDIARKYIGQYLKSGIKFIPAQNRWR